LNTEPAAPPVTLDPRLDALILECATTEWCKVAILISRATDAARAASLEAPAQVIAAHIYALAASHRLDVQGNVRRWRAADVRQATAA
jgi:hypothetical protein